MCAQRQERRLAAIMAVDMVAYSRHMEADEAGTLAALRAHRQEIVDPAISEHNGRIFKTTGDGLLAEFASVMDAVLCAIAFQRAIAEHNAHLPEDDRLSFRVGINLGDVIVEDGDIFGEGVNLAARLESIAEPGGISISGAVRQQLKSKLDVEFEDLGLQSVKNIDEPVQVYRVVGLSSEAVTPLASHETEKSRPRFAVLAVCALTFLLVIAGVAAWLFAGNGDGEREDERVLTATDERTIAVLPFQNLSGDTSQGYFADGIAEDIITDLSKISGLFVIARNTSFQYRDQAMDLVEVGRILGVSYILEGSVRRAGNQVRINAQLIDAGTGGHVWAERYDGTLEDVFSLQDQVTALIIEALSVQLTQSERVAVDAHGTDNPEAYDAYLRGLRYLAERRRVDVEANRAAQLAFEDAIRIDPEYALAHAGLAWAKWLHIETISEYQSIEEVVEIAERSIALEDSALAHRTLAKQHFAPFGFWFTNTSRPDLAVAELERAHELQPSDSDVLADLAFALCFVGRTDEALESIQRARELNPDHPIWYFGSSGVALLLSGNADAAVEHLQAWSQASPSWQTPYLFLAAALGRTGDVEGAEDALARYDDLWGYVSTLRAVRSHWPMHAAQEEIFVDGLRRAGMRDTPGVEDIR